MFHGNLLRQVDDDRWPNEKFASFFGLAAVHKRTQVLG